MTKPTLCKYVHIGGDYQNGFTIGQKSKGVTPTKIIEQGYEDNSGKSFIEYLIFEGEKKVAFISNCAVSVGYLPEESK